MTENEFPSADAYVAKRLADGARDPDDLAKELLRPKFRDLLQPLVRMYAADKVRSYVRAVENDAGREEGSGVITPAKPGTALTPLGARQKLLSESVWIPGGVGFVPYASLTVEMARLRIAYMEGVMEGAARSIRWLKAVIDAIERNSVMTFGEVPPDDPLF